MTYILFLDDERQPTDTNSVVVRSYEEAIDYVRKHGCPSHVDFDHDLGGIKTGYDFALWLVDRDISGYGFPETYAVHSQNPIGNKNISMLIERYKKYKETLK